MVTNIRIPDEAIPDLITIRELGPESLERIYDSLAKIAPLPLRPKTLAEHVASVSEWDDPSKVANLVRQLLAFYHLIKRRGLDSSDELLENIRIALEEVEPPWSEEELLRWREVEPVLGRLIMCDAVRTVSKATLLEYDFANLFKSGRIVTDIRPVFNDLDEEKLSIDGAVVSHTLRLSYDNASGDHDLSLAMDKQDILALIHQCQRALQKAQRAKLLVSTKGFPCVICGDDSDA